MSPKIPHETSLRLHAAGRTNDSLKCLPTFDHCNHSVRNSFDSICVYPPYDLKYLTVYAFKCSQVPL